MKNINVFKIGNTVKISVSGKLQQKNCGSAKEADELFRIALKAKEDPTDANMKAIRMFLNEKTRVAMMAGLECDTELGEVYLAGFNTPIPNVLVDVIKDYHENGYPLDAVINFWKLLMINPDTRVRTSLFDFITAHDFSLTDKGYMIVYKSVYLKDEGQKEETLFAEFISNRYLHVKKTWKESPKNYVVYKDENGNYAITKIETAEKWDEEEKSVEVLGNLAELFEAIFNSDNKTGEESTPIYTDMYSRTMTIQLGKPTGIQRVECDSDPSVDCSYGLHCGATKYVEKFANGNSTILACFVNPANVVAVPKYDHSKMRVSEYFPFAIATYEDGKIDIVKQQYFEDDYSEYEIEELEAQIEKVQAEELPIETAQKAEKESRPMAELMKMLESRLVDIE
jgi:hypothetical protein